MYQALYYVQKVSNLLENIYGTNLGAFSKTLNSFWEIIKQTQALPETTRQNLLEKSRNLFFRIFKVYKAFSYAQKVS